MPSARCINCSKHHHVRGTRGSKLSDRTCICGGKLERVSGNHTLSGEHPLNPAYTFNDSRFYVGNYFYAVANSKKELFVYHDGAYHKIENPVFAESVKK